MADINLTSGNDVYVQPDSDRYLWNHIHGLQGADTIRLFQGIAIGGPGNDRFEKLDPAGNLQLAFWSAGADLLVNLLEGWANDGEGGRDTFETGFTHVHGSGAANARVIGNALANYYWPNWGTDTFEGGAGYDGISLNSGHVEVSPGKFRNLLIDEVHIVVTPDGRTATVTPKVGPSWSITTVDVEYFDIRASATDDAAPWTQYRFADFITPQSMAEQVVAAGGTLRWNATGALGTAVTVSYSFVNTAPSQGVGATGFRSFNDGERAAVRELLVRTSALTGLNFQEVTETGATVGQLRFGVSQQASTKGQAYLPNQSGAGDLAGDVWMDVETMAVLDIGSEGYQALLHELGHALGLRHTRNVDAGDIWSMQLREEDDRTALSVMSQVDSADGLCRSDWGPLDVLALRHLYGSRSVASGNDTYRLTPDFGNRQTTITDDGGIDTLDASGLVSGVQLTLVPASLSNVGISDAGIYGIDNLAITAGTVIEHAIGTSTDDELIGNDADNSLTGGIGNDWIDGGNGTDTAVFGGVRADYEVDHAFGFTYVSARDGVSGFDTLVNVERLQFADVLVTLGSGVPLAEDIEVSVDEDATISGSLPLPAGLSDRSAASWTLLSSPAHGSALVAANGSYLYTPAANFWGSDSFAYRVTTSGGNNTYRVYVDVKPVNDAAPVGRAQTLIIGPGVAYSGQLPAATDADGDALVYAVSGEPAHGELAFASDGRYTYTPAAGWYGDDSFVYTVSDGMGGSSSHAITLRVGLSTPEDTTLVTTLPDPIVGARATATYRLVGTAATLGQATLTAQGQLSYVPHANQHGVDRLSYEVVVGTTTTRTDVAVQVVSINDGPPTAMSTAYTLSEDGQLLVQLPAATDPDGSTFTYTLDTAPLMGTATVSASGALSYAPASNVHGIDTLAFRVTDADGASNRYTVTLTVTAQNDRPVAAPASATLGSGQTLVGVLPGASDADGDRVTYAVATPPALGQLTLNGLGFYSYTPQAGATGSDSFSYLVRDAQGASSTYAVTLSLLPATAAAAPSGPAVLALAHERAATNPTRGLDLRSSRHDDTLTGGSGVDSAHFAGPRTEHLVQRVGDTLFVRDQRTDGHGDGTDALVSVERLVFGDQLLAFGARAEEVARVAFALWSPAIVDSTTLFARGLSYYDQGVSFAALCEVALQFFPEQGEAFARLLLRQSGSTRSVDELLQLMANAGGGDAGRAAAVAAVAWDASVTAALHTTGVINHGLAADLSVPGFGVLFVSLAEGR